MKMIDFKTFRHSLTESLNEETVKKFKVKGMKAEVRKKGNMFFAYFDGEQLDDSYRTEKEAENEIRQFAKLLEQE